MSDGQPTVGVTPFNPELTEFLFYERDHIMRFEYKRTKTSIVSLIRSLSTFVVTKIGR